MKNWLPRTPNKILANKIHLMIDFCKGVYLSSIICISTIYCVGIRLYQSNLLLYLDLNKTYL